MDNAIYSKIIENIRNRIDVKLVSNKKDYLKWISKPSYISDKILNNNLFTKCQSKVTSMFNCPAYIRTYILELSKILMHKFHYDYIKKKYGNNSKLLQHIINRCLTLKLEMFTN